MVLTYLSRAQAGTLGVPHTDSIGLPTRANPSSRLGVARPRDRRGRFNGDRVNVDRVPRLPTFPARWVLEDPRGRTYFVFWSDPGGKLVRALLMAPSDDRCAILLSTPYILRRRFALERRHQWGGQVLFYVCAGCNRPRRYLYPWEMIDGRLVHDLSLRCAQCVRLRYSCQVDRGPGTPVVATGGTQRECGS